MKKKLIAVLAACTMVMMTILTGCGNGGDDEPAQSSTGETNDANTASADGKVGCILGVGGLGDQAFNDLIYEGLDKAKSELGIDFDYAEPTQVSEFELIMRDMASSGEYAAIICVGFDQTDALAKVAPEFPEQDFAFIDGAMDADNVVNYAAKEEEGSFLAGALVGLMKADAAAYDIEDNNKAGFIAALETPLLLKWNAGYMAGAKYVNPDMEILSDFVDGDNPFGDTTTAKEIAISQYNQGADIIFHAAGGSGLGLFDAAKEYDFYAIGCNSNQNIINPDNILASILKRVDTAAYEIAKAAVIDGNLDVGTTVVLGLTEEGMDYTLEQSNIEVGSDIIDTLDEIKQMIVDKEIEVPDTMEDAADFTAANSYTKAE